MIRIVERQLDVRRGSISSVLHGTYEGFDSAFYSDLTSLTRLIERSKDNKRYRPVGIIIEEVEDTL